MFRKLNSLLCSLVQHVILHADTTATGLSGKLCLYTCIPLTFDSEISADSTAADRSGKLCL